MKIFEGGLVLEGAEFRGVFGSWQGFCTADIRHQLGVAGFVQVINRNSLR